MPVVESFLNSLSLEKQEFNSYWTDELTASLSEAKTKYELKASNLKKI